MNLSAVIHNHIQVKRAAVWSTLPHLQYSSTKTTKIMLNRIFQSFVTVQNSMTGVVTAHRIG